MFRAALILCLALVAARPQDAPAAWRVVASTREARFFVAVDSRRVDPDGFVITVEKIEPRRDTREGRELDAYERERLRTTGDPEFDEEAARLFAFRVVVRAYDCREGKARASQVSWHDSRGRRFRSLTLKELKASGLDRWAAPGEGSAGAELLKDACAEAQ